MPPTPPASTRARLRALRRGLDKRAVLVPAAFLSVMGVATVVLGMNFFLREELGATGEEVGWFFALWSLSYVLGLFILQPLAARARPRLLATGASVLVAAAYAMLPFCRSLTPAFVLYSFTGFITGVYWPPLMGWLAQGLEGKALSRAMSWYNLAWSTGSSLGPLVAGLLGRYSLRLPLYVGTGFLLLATLILDTGGLVVPRDPGDKPTDAPRGGGAPDHSTRFRFPAWIGVFSGFAVLGVLAYIFPYSAREELHLSKLTIGVIVFCRSLFLSLAFVILGRSSFWHYRTWPTVASQVGLAALMAGAMFCRAPAALAVIFAAVGVLASYTYFSSMYYGAAGSSRPTSRMALHEGLLSGGLMVGALGGGLLYQGGSMRRVYGVCAGLCLVTAGVQYGLCRWARAREARR